ncbi:CpaD family pilus assembly protein [Henriciella litoralis]|uniref:CpaD family pilus assembly protein n=1 Tax=Henriciella litoralis TaxID=568102 RepID=UPI0009FC47FE|nr:CpaD family pilus assembly protein [Henriciella litoralis]
MMRVVKLALVTGGFGAVLAISGCQAGGRHGPIPAEYLTGTTLDRNAIGVAEQTQSLEVFIDPRGGRLSAAERGRIETFVSEYRRRGHGPLVVSVPAIDPSGRVGTNAVSEASDIAWSQGVDYADIRGNAYDPQGRTDAPMLLTFRAYEAIAPVCLQKSAYDFANAVSNNDMPSLGCSVRTNMAAMIADPADVFGDRPLDPGDAQRRTNQLQLYRDGETTTAQRSDQETGTVSTAVN